MKILALAQVENAENALDQISKQTLQPSEIQFYIDNKPVQGINARRKKIAANHNRMLRHIVRNTKCDFIWQIEQDVDLADDTLERLVSDYVELEQQYGKDLDYVSGIQVGRHGLYVLGAWRNFTDKTFESIDYKLTGIQEVEATGFYCLFISKDKWLKGKCKWDDEPYGPDVVWGRSLKGKKFVDMDIQVGHIIKGGVIRPTDMSTCNVKFFNDGGLWRFKQL